MHRTIVIGRELLWCAAGIAVLLVASIQNARGLFQALDIRRTHYTYLGQDFPPTLISPDKHTYDSRLYNDNSVHYGFNDTNEWESLFPPGSGFVRLGPDGRLFGVSMYSQLHCLNHLRIAVLRDPEDEKERRHTQHCINYLRQSILCRSPLKLEGVIVNYYDGKLGAHISGLGYEHVCRDWSHVRTTVEGNYLERPVEHGISYYP